MKLPFIPAVPNKGAMFSWALYDFADNIFVINVLSLYFALWVTVDKGAPDIVYSVAFSGSMLVVALTSPMLGAASDRYGRRLPFLMAFSGMCVVATALLGMTNSLVVALLLFVAANYGYQSALIYYDALLAKVGQTGVQGLVSGIGVGMGFAGTIVGILMVRPFVDAGGRGDAFVPTALLYLVFALPCFLFVKETGPARWDFAHLAQGYRQLITTFQESRRYGNLLRFIGARFLYTDAINTILAFMAVYLVKVTGFSDHDVQNLLITSVFFGMVGAFVYGKVADYLGPRRTLIVVLMQWTLVFFAVAFASGLPAFYVIGAAVGFGLGGTGTADRVLLTHLAPPERRGEFFGLYGLAGRFSAVIGPLVWGLTLWVFQDWGLVSYRVAVLTLCVALVAGLVVLLGVRDTPVETGALASEEYAESVRLPREG